MILKDEYKQELPKNIVSGGGISFSDGSRKFDTLIKNEMI